MDEVSCSSATSVSTFQNWDSAPVCQLRNEHIKRRGTLSLCSSFQWSWLTWHCLVVALADTRQRSFYLNLFIFPLCYQRGCCLGNRDDWRRHSKVRKSFHRAPLPCPARNSLQSTSPSFLCLVIIAGNWSYPQQEGSLDFTPKALECQCSTFLYYLQTLLIRHLFLDMKFSKSSILLPGNFSGKSFKQLSRKGSGQMSSWWFENSPG